MIEWPAEVVDASDRILLWESQRPLTDWQIGDFRARSADRFLEAYVVTVETTGEGFTSRSETVVCASSDDDAIASVRTWTEWKFTGDWSHTYSARKL